MKLSTNMRWRISSEHVNTLYCKDCKSHEQNAYGGKFVRYAKGVFCDWCYLGLSIYEGMET